MSLSEVLVFYQALQNPRILTQQQIQEQLDLSSIPESNSDKQTENVGNNEITPLQKRAQKMFYKVWNGTSKHLKNVLLQQRKAVELPGFGIFAPVTISTAVPLDDSKSTKGTASSEIDYLMGQGNLAGGMKK